jgi:hypothetical protein
METETEKAIQYAQKLLDAGLAVVAAARVSLDANWARNPKVVALTLLCRSLTNFRAAILLTQQRHVVEARILVRCLYENLLWIGALRERGAAFVDDMVRDERHNRKALAQLTLKLSGKHGGDPNDTNGLILRSIIKEMATQFPQTEKLRAGDIAAAGAVELAYVEYQRLSLDAVHCSVTALGRHLSRETAEGQVELVVSVEANTPPREFFETILQACRALMGVAIGTNEIVGFTEASSRLNDLVTEFESNEWVRL